MPSGSKRTEPDRLKHHSESIETNQPYYRDVTVISGITYSFLDRKFGQMSRSSLGEAGKI